MTGHAPNTGTNATSIAPNGAETGFTPGLTAMNVVTVEIATGRKDMVMASTGKKAIATAGIGTGIGTIAITPNAMRRIRDMTDMAGITTGARRTTA